MTTILSDIISYNTKNDIRKSTRNNKQGFCFPKLDHHHSLNRPFVCTAANYPRCVNLIFIEKIYVNEHRKKDASFSGITVYWSGKMQFVEWCWVCWISRWTAVEYKMFILGPHCIFLVCLFLQNLLYICKIFG